MAEPNLPIAPPLTPSPESWLHCVLDNFDAFLQDHASCEKKASGMAMAVASHYPDQPDLLKAMVDLAVEELNHYREVIRLMLAKQITPAPDSKDPYINQLNKHIRRGPENFLLDRLLVGAVVERRGAERFALVGNNLEDPQLAKFYSDIAASEHRHWVLFYDLALSHCQADEVAPRFAELAALEAEIMLALPPRPALH
jgi:tRNA 2-(methylsulfanyl)-N6-isopentenyladenosine37 hydroxylase